MVQDGSLPDGWVWTTLSNITNINGRDSTIRDLPDDFLVSFVPMAAVDGEQGIIARPKVCALKEVRKGYTSFSDGDVIFAKITPCMENGKAAIAEKLQNGRGFGSTEFHVLRPKDGLASKWLFHFVRQDSFRGDAKAHFTGTAGQLRVPASFLAEYAIPLPPLPEQERIVAKIEALFTQLEAGTAALKRIQVGLKRYKASVLKAACEGRLVQSKIVHPDNIIQDIFPSWQIKRLKEIADIIDPHPSHRTPPEESNGIPYVGMGDIDNLGNFDFENARKVSPKILEEHHTRYQLHDGDFIFGKIGTIGKPFKVKPPYEYSLSANVILVQPKREHVDSDFLFMYMSSPLMESLLLAGSRATTQAAFGILKSRELIINLPPYIEQRHIVAEVDCRLSVAQELEQVVAANLQRAGRLRQAILKRAFEGRLV